MYTFIKLLSVLPEKLNSLYCDDLFGKAQYLSKALGLIRLELINKLFK